MVYETPAERMAALGPFIREGFKRNEACALITDEENMPEVSSNLESQGIRVAEEQQRGSLFLLNYRQSYLRGGRFDPEGMLRYLDDTVRKQVERGHAGFRVTGEMSWALGTKPDCDRLLEYETLLNKYLPGSQVVGICQYDRTRVSPRVIYDVLRTHPIAIVGDRFCSNQFFEPPEVILRQGGLAHRVNWMLMQLKRSHDAEQKLRQWNQALEHNVKARTASLKESKDQMEAFAYSVSHDLRAPLRAMLGYSQILRDDYSSKLDGEALNYLKRIGASARRMDQLIVDLLEYSRVAQIELLIGRVPLEGPVRRAMAQLSDADADIHVDASLPPVRGVSTLLEQIFRNLLSNAIKFVPPGVRPRIHIEAEPLVGRVRVWIRDNGIGIPEECIPNLFKLFSRVGAGGFPGTGAGLAIVRRALERMGGNIGVESTPGVGSNFWIELPAA